MQPVTSYILLFTYLFFLISTQILLFLWIVYSHLDTLSENSRAVTALELQYWNSSTEVKYTDIHIYPKERQHIVCQAPSANEYWQFKQSYR